MASCSAYSFREFLFAEICKQLSKEEVKNIAFSQNLPPDYLVKDGPEVLLKLEASDKFSEFNLTPLVEIMKLIGRKDLSKKVEKFAKKKQKQHKKKAPPNILMMKQFQITSNSKMSSLLLKIAVDQFKETQAVAIEIGNLKVAEVAASAAATIEQQLLEKLSQISSHLSRETIHSHRASEDFSIASSGSSLESSYRETNPSPPLASPPSLLSDQSDNVQVEEQEEHNYDYIETRSFLSRSTNPRDKENCGEGEMVTGRDGQQPSKLKPPIAPKPRRGSSIKPTDNPSDIMPEDSSDTCTGDSGFEDATKFRKDYCPKPAPRRLKYQPMQAKQREEVGYYSTTKRNISETEALYEEPSLPVPDPVYANLPVSRRCGSLY